ncbi:hypothetical protein GQ44DRAFT_42181 [Phaeosphaeriaceae sp. PMI808]|nr:hypothetical protein GQ44DRAFT_42181 [Phaeosphaeriaceae sp. PMI808]
MAAKLLLPGDGLCQAIEIKFGLHKIADSKNHKHDAKIQAPTRNLPTTVTRSSRSDADHVMRTTVTATTICTWKGSSVVDTSSTEIIPGSDTTTSKPWLVACSHATTDPRNPPTMFYRAAQKLALAIDKNNSRTSPGHQSIVGTDSVSFSISHLIDTTYVVSTHLVLLNPEHALSSPLFPQ